MPTENDDIARFKHPCAREVFRDEALLVLDKPAGVLSHPNPPRSGAPGALFRAPYDFKEESYSLRGLEGKERRIYLVHRLDKETSGVILCAFDRESAAVLKAELRGRGVEKEYRALVFGLPRPASGRWIDRLEKLSQGRQATVRVRPQKRGAAPARGDSRTRYEVLEVFEPSRLALLALWPETGRTHQLRVQAATRGLPIAGDERYGDFPANRFLAREVGLKRMFLHACRMAFHHPRSGRLIRVEASLPAELDVVLGKLKELRKRIPRRES